MTPLLLNLKQAAQLLGVSERKFHQLRGESWLPLPILCGSRSQRWHRDELADAAKMLAPRVSDRPEPLMLAQARKSRGAAA